MRMTRDHYSVVQVLAELIPPGGVTDADTKTFFAGERTSHDWLVQAWASKLDVVLESFQRTLTTS